MGLPHAVSVIPLAGSCFPLRNFPCLSFEPMSCFRSLEPSRVSFIRHFFFSLWHRQATELSPDLAQHLLVCLYCTVCGCHLSAVWPQAGRTTSLCLSLHLQNEMVIPKRLADSIGDDWLTKWSDLINAEALEACKPTAGIC